MGRLKPQGRELREGVGREGKGGEEAKVRVCVRVESKHGEVGGTYTLCSRFKAACLLGFFLRRACSAIYCVFCLCAFTVWREWFT